MVLIALFCTFGLSLPLTSETAAKERSLDSSSQPETLPSPNSGSSAPGDLDSASTLILGGLGGGFYGGFGGYGGYPYYGGYRNW